MYVERSSVILDKNLKHKIAGLSGDVMQTKTTQSVTITTSMSQQVTLGENVKVLTLDMYGDISKKNSKVIEVDDQVILSGNSGYTNIDYKPTVPEQDTFRNSVYINILNNMKPLELCYLRGVISSSYETLANIIKKSSIVLVPKWIRLLTKEKDRVELARELTTKYSYTGRTIPTWILDSARIYVLEYIKGTILQNYKVLSEEVIISYDNEHCALDVCRGLYSFAIRTRLYHSEEHGYHIVVCEDKDRLIDLLNDRMERIKPSHQSLLMNVGLVNEFVSTFNENDISGHWAEDEYLNYLKLVLSTHSSDNTKCLEELCEHIPNLKNTKLYSMYSSDLSIDKVIKVYFGESDMVRLRGQDAIINNFIVSQDDNAL